MIAAARTISPLPTATALALVLQVVSVVVADPVSGQLPTAPESGAVSGASGPPLALDDVLASIESTYPPVIAARMERDLREGRLRSARSAYDFALFGKVGGTLDGYYEYTATEIGAEQFLGLWGSTVYGGYRLTEGETLPDYYGVRTQASGAASVGLRVPLLKGGPIDPARAGAQAAEIYAEGAAPAIARQRLDFVRAGSVAYFKWLAAGRKLELAEALLELAEDRADALEEQVENGLQPDIVLVDNERLVVSRRLDVTRAERDFRAAALVLSLFVRDADGAPVTPDRDRLPDDFPEIGASEGEEPDVQGALARRPELRVLELELEQIGVEERLASNSGLPKLDASIEATRNYGDILYSDRDETELRGELSFSFPLQRRDATGKQREIAAKMEQARQKLRYAQDKVVAEVRDARIALEAARELIEASELNVSLAQQLRDAEQQLFQAGSSDLLALQIREQAAFDAESKAIEAWLEYFAAQADYRAAIAEGVDPGVGPEGN